jgi:hypothetical protein
MHRGTDCESPLRKELLPDQADSNSEPRNEKGNLEASSDDPAPRVPASARMFMSEAAAQSHIVRRRAEPPGMMLVRTRDAKTKSLADLLARDD